MPDAPEPSPTLEAQIIQVIAQTQRLPLDSVTIDSTFEQLNIDSLDGINIIFALENEFGIEIPDDGVNSMRSLREIANGVRKLVQEKSRGASSGAA
jgi:acyl carrier protein